MLEAMVQALTMLFQPTHLGALLAGVAFGLFLGLVPGLSGMVGLAVLLPFTLYMEPSVGIALIMGMLSVTSTSDTIPAVLFGVPGTAASQATVLDGYPMARRGEAERALQAAFLASIVGGLIGTSILALSVPVLRPIVLSLGSPEFFMLGLMGITMIATLSSGSTIRGLLVGVFGLILSTVGTSVLSTTPRWTFGQLYLMDGIPLIPAVLGLFAVPEMIELFVGNKSLSESSLRTSGNLWARLRQAARDVFGHWFLVLRCAIVGTWVGAVPGLGGTVVDWFAYGHAVSTEKGARETFGTGDIRGVLAPESANNAKNGGELIPTLAFGIPGSGSMAVLLGGLIFHDIRPGPEMLTSQLHLTLLMVWSIALANIVGGGVCFLLTRQLARITMVRQHYLIPLIFVVVMFAAYQSTRQIGDLVTLLAFSVLGWVMKVSQWPRPPFVLGFVLGPILENYLFLSLGRYGMSWLLRPGVLVIAVLTAATLAYGIFTARQSPGSSPPTVGPTGKAAETIGA